MNFSGFAMPEASSALNCALNFSTSVLLEAATPMCESGAAISFSHARPLVAFTNLRKRKAWKSLLKPPRILPCMLSRLSAFVAMECSSAVLGGRTCLKEVSDATRALSWRQRPSHGWWGATVGGRGGGAKERTGGRPPPPPPFGVATKTRLGWG